MASDEYRNYPTYLRRRKINKLLEPDSAPDREIRKLVVSTYYLKNKNYIIAKKKISVPLNHHQQVVFLTCLELFLSFQFQYNLSYPRQRHQKSVVTLLKDAKLMNIVFYP